MDLDEKIRQFLCDLLDVDETEIADDAFLTDDLGMNPGDLEELTLTLQDEFEVEIPDVDAEDWETVADIASYLLDKLEND